MRVRWRLRARTTHRLSHDSDRSVGPVLAARPLLPILFFFAKEGRAGSFVVGLKGRNEECVVVRACGGRGNVLVTGKEAF